MAATDYTIPGATFSRLTVTSDPFKTEERGRWKVRCRCECGVEIAVICQCLTRGTTKSCGCLKRKHGHWEGGRASPTYASWISAKSRCYDQSHESYKDYGGRGISMCRKWEESFEAFLADMGERPDGMTLDRYPDTNGNYEPGNCRWATALEQLNNRRDNIRLMHDGVLKTARQIAREVGISYQTIRTRLSLGWSPERAISTPVRRALKTPDR